MLAIKCDVKDLDQINMNMDINKHIFQYAFLVP